MSVVEGVGVGGAATGLDNLQNTVLDATAIASQIDEIANDPALGGVTGSIEGGGGNDVNEFNVMQRAYYGDDGLNLIEKIAQLENTTFLAARKMLKGGGAITDFESRKAEGAMGRLKRSKSEEQFKAALKDLRDAVTAGAEKLNGGATDSSPPAQGGATAPAGLDPADWESMTPEEKALFQ